MSYVKKQLDLIDKFTKVIYTEKHLTNDVLSLTDSIVNQHFSDNEPLHFAYTVGDIRNIRGFYLCPQMIHNMLTIFIARHLRMLILTANLDVANTKVATKIALALQSTEQLEQDLPPKIIELARQKFGDVADPDFESVRQLVENTERFAEQAMRDINDQSLH